MPRREDDDIDVVAGLSASRDDVGSDKPMPAKPAASTQSVRPNSDSDAHSTGPSVNKTGSGFKWLVALILLLMIAAGGWLSLQVLELEQRLSDSNSALQLERSRIESISAQVYETGSSFAETGNVLETKFIFFESEIRKLWDVTNKRNKKDIASNAARVKNLDGNIKKYHQASQRKLNALTGGQTETAQTVAKLNKRLTSEQTKTTQAVAKFNKRLASENTALRASLEEQSEQLFLIRGEFEVLQQRLKNLPNNLSQRVAINEEAVQAIDASRQQLQARLRKLQQQVDQLLPIAP